MNFSSVFSCIEDKTALVYSKEKVQSIRARATISMVSSGDLAIKRSSE